MELAISLLALFISFCAIYWARREAQAVERSAESSKQAAAAAHQSAVSSATAAQISERTEHANWVTRIAGAFDTPRAPTHHGRDQFELAARLLAMLPEHLWEDRRKILRFAILEVSKFTFAAVLEDSLAESSKGCLRKAERLRADWQESVGTTTD